MPHDMGIPSVVLVGPYRYTVDVEPKAFVGDGNTTLCGECNHQEGRIRIMSGTMPRMFTTLWHEILHAIDDVAGTDLTEDQVNRLAPLLVTFFVQNHVYRNPDAPE